VASLDRFMRCERKEVEKWIRMCEGHGTLPRQPVHSGKDLGPGVAWQQGGEFIQRAGAGPSELLLDGRVDRVSLCHD